MSNQAGVFDIVVLCCISQNAGPTDEQLLETRLFPSSLKNIETVYILSA